MVSQVYRDRRGTPVDLVDYIGAVHRQARIARIRDVSFRLGMTREWLARVAAAAIRRIDHFIFPPPFIAR